MSFPTRLCAAALMAVPVVALVAGCSTYAPTGGGSVASQAPAPQTSASSDVSSLVSTPSATSAKPAPTSASPSASTKTSATAKPSASTKPAASAKPSAIPTSAKPTPVAGATLYGPGATGAKVREIQARLRQIGWFSGNVSDYYGTQTAAAVRGFQAKRGIAVTGAVDQRTLDLLVGMTHRPTADDLANKAAGGESGAPAKLDPRCLTGRVLCIDKSARTLRWVVNGVVQRSFDVRFGDENNPTREGSFSVFWKHADHVSSLYHTKMPYAMFFSGGEAVHYSSDFAARGYAGHSHGCVNVRDYAGIQWLFGQVSVGDKVIVYA